MLTRRACGEIIARFTLLESYADVTPVDVRDHARHLQSSHPHIHPNMSLILAPVYHSLAHKPQIFLINVIK